MTDELTPVQRAVLDFIVEYQRKHQSAPTRSEISERFGWASRNAAETHVKALVRKGFLLCRADRARGIKVAEVSA